MLERPELYDEMSAEEEARINFKDSLADIMSAIQEKDKDGAEAAIAQAQNYAHMLPDLERDSAILQLQEYRKEIEKGI